MTFPLAYRIRLFGRVAASYGWREAFFDLYHRARRKAGKKTKGDSYYFVRPDYPHPLCARYESSDNDVIRQVLDERQYGLLDDVAAPQLIIDCGAYCGYTALYFLARFPNAHLVAVEPDESNLRICRKNLKRVPLSSLIIIRAGIWTHPAGLRVLQNTYKDKREWATQVRESQAGEQPDTQAVDLYSLLENSGFQRISILKLDIERSEAVLFAKNYERWLDRVDHIAIELHDKECEDIFFKAMAGYDYTLARRGEVTFCKNIIKKRPASRPE